jgi:hypothetical protein
MTAAAAAPPHDRHLPHLQAVDYVNYDKPSPIQMASIPLGLKQLDVIGVAETGSGKTAAFVIPMLCYIIKQPVMDESNYAGVLLLQATAAGCKLSVAFGFNEVCVLLMYCCQYW